MSKTAGKKSEKIREQLNTVQVFARTGRLPLTSAYEDWINPTTKRKVPGVVLNFGDSGVCELDPVRDAVAIKALNEWLEDGTDERISELGVMIVQHGLKPPFPKWDNTNPDKIPEMVGALGLDAAECLRYELAKGDDARKKLVKALEVLVDAVPEEDDLDEPVLD